jgi:hypothetical protein
LLIRQEIWPVQRHELERTKTNDRKTRHFSLVRHPELTSRDGAAQDALPIKIFAKPVRRRIE